MQKRTASSGAQLGEPLLTSSQVAQMFRVHRQTVCEWVRSGRLGAIRTPGGHYRYVAAQIRALLSTPAPRTSEEN